MSELDKDRDVIARATDGPWAWAQPGQKENGFVVGLTEPPHEGLLTEPDQIYNEDTDEWEDPPDYPEPVEQVCEQWGATVNYHDAAFIARARTRYPELVEEVTRLRDGIRTALDGGFFEGGACHPSQEGIDILEALLETQ